MATIKERKGTVPTMIRTLIVAAILAANLSFGSVGTAAAATTCCSIQQTYGGVFVIQQTGSVYYSGRTPGWVAPQWINCRWDGLIQIHVTWCSAYRVSNSQIDIGYNYTKAFTVLGIGVTQTCWSRRMYYSGGDVGPQRQGC